MRSRQHFGQQFHRQADDVRLAAFDDVDPAEAVLVAERAGFAFPLAAGQVFVELCVGERIHPQPGDGDADERRTFTPAPLRRETEIKWPQADAGEDAVFAAAELREHRPGIGFVARFAEDEAVAFGDGVGGEDDAGAGGVASLADADSGSLCSFRTTAAALR